MASFSPANFASSQPQAIPRHTPRPQFGERDQPPSNKPTGDRADISATAQSNPPTENSPPTPLSTEERQKQAEAQVRNFFQDLSERFHKFLKTIRKAFQQLLGAPKPQSSLKMQFKAYRQAVHESSQSPEAQKAVQKLGERLQAALAESPLTEQERKRVGLFAKTLKDPTGQRRYIEHVLNEWPAISLQQHLQLLRDGVGDRLLEANMDDDLQFVQTGEQRSPIAKYETLIAPKEEKKEEESAAK